MREHQIVITLKPEQFLQVQKLAKNAGAKSMGMFVRQKLLLALGIEGSAQAPSTADIEPLVGELKRLHTELREFVNESLAMYSDGLLNGSLGTPVGDDAPVAVADPSPVPAQLQAEAPDRASQTFQKTQIESPQEEKKPAPELQTPVGHKTFPKAFMEAKPAAAKPDQAMEAETGASEVASSQSPQTTTAGALNSGNSDFQEVPSQFEADQPAPQELQEHQVDTVPDEAENYVEENSAEAGSDSDLPSMINDEMEATANKTFAISPRLGPIEQDVDDNPSTLPHTPSFRTVERKKWIPGTDENRTPPTVQEPPSPNTTESTPPVPQQQPPIQKPGYTMPTRHQSKRDPLAELLSADDFEKERKPAPQFTPNNDPTAAEDETDETFDIPLSILARKRQMEQPKEDESADESTVQEPERKLDAANNQIHQKNQNLNSNSAQADQSAQKAHPHHSRIHSAETNLSSDDETPQTTGAQDSNYTPHRWQPLENPDEDTPFSGGPPPKKRQ
ncbi:MAG: hypothetical protein K2X77_34175 [Candidatus Obscuribacterales bacterium]|jgi:hypothetical protein|nr:hypothetical protein [Candidatus Obscuribacterales bacterium]